MGSLQPNFMIPRKIIVISSIPYSPEGKIDYKLLPYENTSTNEEIIRPSNETEQKILEFWAKFLKIDTNKISINMNFFELGGNSLSITMVIAEIIKFLTEVKALNVSQSDIISNLMKTPTIEGMSLTISEQFVKL